MVNIYIYVSVLRKYMVMFFEMICTIFRKLQKCQNFPENFRRIPGKVPGVFEVKRNDTARKLSFL